MARTALVPTKPTPAGVAPNLVAVDAANGMSFVWRVDSILHVKTTGTIITVTIPTVVTFADGLVLPNRVVATVATGEIYIGPFPQQEYMQTDLNIYVNFSVATGGTVEVIQPSA